MNIALGTEDNTIKITEGDAHVLLTENNVSIDGYDMNFPGEYERRGIFVETRALGEHQVYILTIDSKTLIYLPAFTNSDDLEVLRDVNNKDLIIFPANEALWKTLETWEASVVIPYGHQATEFLGKLGQTPEPTAAVNIKASDFESEVTRFIALG